jgi:LPXTG-motif cell wall-anchored protein
MLTGSMVLKRAMVFGALALSTSALAGHAVHAAVPGTGRSCTTENWVWSGSTTFGLTTTAFDTDMVVPVVAGTDLTVVGISADGLSSTGQARAMAVTIGGVAAVTGGAVPGGAVVVLADGAPAQVNGVTVTLDRCADVQSGAPGEPSGLPRTGATAQQGGSLIGALAVGVGSAMIVAGRRRAPHSFVD